LCFAALPDRVECRADSKVSGKLGSV
jgi:hypothetical protein